MILCVRIVSILNPLLLTTNQMITVTALSFTRAVITLIQMNFIADSVYKKGNYYIVPTGYVFQEGEESTQQCHVPRNSNGFDAIYFHSDTINVLEDCKTQSSLFNDMRRYDDDVCYNFYTVVSQC
ncbi:hypothetical protein CEXT_465691 [Caerostris extrusa]|uniref:Uncharacterized protein n=1 Tax=Caerostris extrusa TaxID=172846 RepID=A0AAV4PQX5_CAEEX|nr:hypothetical protein CEXT_465691 [Caerostris extrusa]